MRGKCDIEEGYLNCAQPFTRVSKYKRGSDITEVRVYKEKTKCPNFLSSMLFTSPYQIQASKSPSYIWMSSQGIGDVITSLIACTSRCI